MPAMISCIQKILSSHIHAPQSHWKRSMHDYKYTDVYILQLCSWLQIQDSQINNCRVSLGYDCITFTSQWNKHSRNSRTTNSAVIGLAGPAQGTTLWLALQDPGPSGSGMSTTGLGGLWQALKSVGTKTLFYSTLVAVIGSVSFGYGNGFSSPALPDLDKNNGKHTRFNRTLYHDLFNVSYGI